jgi:hypothetical protein
LVLLLAAVTTAAAAAVAAEELFVVCSCAGVFLRLLVVLWQDGHFPGLSYFAALSRSFQRVQSGLRNKDRR